MTEPKTCPICGGKPHFNECGTLKGHYSMVVCSVKEHLVWACADAETLEKARELAVEKWNTRHYPAEVQQAVERMKPKKPLRTNKNPNFRIYSCPNCRKLKGIRNQYCGNCGQALDWGE